VTTESTERMQASTSNTHDEIRFHRDPAPAPLSGGLSPSDRLEALPTPVSLSAIM
jgi:hypothetical protein